MTTYKNSFLFIAMMTAALSILSSCGKKNYSRQIQQIDSLLSDLQQIAVQYNSLDFRRLSAQFDSVNQHLEYVQKNYVGYQREDMAKVFSDYRQVKKLIPDLASAQSKITTEINTDLEQLTNLKQAMIEGASHDAAGNKITEEYMDKAFRDETKAANDLMAQLNLLLLRAPKADSIYQANYEKVRFWVDSIPALPAQTLQVPK